MVYANDETLKEPRWIHYRMRDKNGQILRNGGMTLCYQSDPELGTIKYAISFCNKVDEFSKVLGRNRALGRLKSRDNVYDNAKVDIVEGENPIMTIRNVYLNFVNEEESFEERMLRKRIVYYTTPINQERKCKTS